MPYPYSSAKIILQRFLYSQCAVHENSRRLSHDDASKLASIQFKVKTSKHLYLCTWEVLHLSEKELYTGLRYGVAEFSALISKSFPCILHTLLQVS